MWSLIEEVLSHLDGIPDKTKMNEKQVLELYNIVKEADEMFRMLAQIAKLKKAIDELNKK